MKIILEDAEITEAIHDYISSRPWLYQKFKGRAVKIVLRVRPTGLFSPNKGCVEIETVEK